MYYNFFSNFNGSMLVNNNLLECINLYENVINWFFYNTQVSYVLNNLHKLK